MILNKLFNFANAYKKIQFQKILVDTREEKFKELRNEFILLYENNRLESLKLNIILFKYTNNELTHYLHLSDDKLKNRLSIKNFKYYNNGLYHYCIKNNITSLCYNFNPINHMLTLNDFLKQNFYRFKNDVDIDNMNFEIIRIKGYFEIASGLNN